jgi:hypothetical protein
MQREERDDIGGPAAGADPHEWMWVRGVDYAAGWREAKNAADALNAALLGADIWPWEFRAVADTDANGAARVRLLGTREGAERLRAALLRIAEQYRADAV